MLLTRITRTLSIFSLALILSACGGGGSTSSQAGNNKSISGSAIKGVIDQGIVNAYELRNGEAFFLLSSRTNNRGDFSLSTTTPSDTPLILELRTDAHTRMKCDLPAGCTTPSSGDHVDFGQWLSLPEDFSLLGVMLPGQANQINISPLSHLIVATAASLEEGLTAHNLKTANAWLQADLRLDFDPLATRTADITALSNGVNQNELEQGIISASFFSMTLSQQWKLNLVDLNDLDLQETFSNMASLAQSLAALHTENAPQLDAQLSSLAASASDIADSIDNETASISAQPQSTTVLEGEPIILRVEATGLTEENIQWFKDNQALPGENLNTLTIASPEVSDQGLYHATVSDTSNTLRSLSALVTVNEQQLPLSVSQHPSSYSLSPGQSATLTVIPAGGIGNYNYVWQKGGSVIPGANTNQLRLTNVSESDAASYRVTISDDATSISSNYATISVSNSIEPVTIHQHPESVTSLEGSELSLSVSASGGGFVSYQWRKNGDNLSNQNSMRLTINPSQVADSGVYDVQVSNSQGSVISNSSMVTILSSSLPLSITQQPQSISLAEGESGSFSVEGEAGTPLSYQWYYNGTTISGATAKRYDITNAYAQDAGTYYVEVRSSTETIRSLTALLTLVTPVNLDLSWEIPTQRENGDALPLAEIRGYVIQYGSAEGSYTNSAQVLGATTTSHVIERLSSGTYYLRIATTDSDGITGAYSDPITVNIP